MQQQATPQTFRRGRDRILGGVCSGLAEGLRIDALWVRLGFVLLAFLQGIGLVIYIVLWLVMPEQVEGQEGTRSGVDSMTADLRRIGVELKGAFGSGTKPVATQESSSGSAPAATPPATSMTTSTPGTAPTRRQSLVLGIVLVAIGLILLAANTGLIQWSIIWPSLLIVVGILLLARTLERRR